MLNETTVVIRIIQRLDFDYCASLHGNYDNAKICYDWVISRRKNEKAVSRITPYETYLAFPLRLTTRFVINAHHFTIFMCDNRHYSLLHHHEMVRRVIFLSFRCNIACRYIIPMAWCLFLKIVIVLALDITKCHIMVALVRNQFVIIISKLYV